MNNKQAAFASVWSRYLPAIRILVKKAVTAAQVISINQTDIERAAGIKKSGYRFSINFIKNKPDLLYSNNDIAQALINVLAEDEVVKEYMLNNDFTFLFNSKYQLHIKNNTAQQEVVSSGTQEVVAG